MNISLKDLFLKKIICICLLVISWIFICGAAPFWVPTVELKNSKEPYIDLGALVIESEIGTSGPEVQVAETETEIQEPETEIQETETEIQETETETETTQETESIEEQATLEETINEEPIETNAASVFEITIHDKEIIVDGGTVENLDTLQSDLSDMYDKGYRVVLIDDYAEYNTYISVKQLIVSKGIALQEEEKN